MVVHSACHHETHAMWTAVLLAVTLAVAVHTLVLRLRALAHRRLTCRAPLVHIDRHDIPAATMDDDARPSCWAALPEELWIVVAGKLPSEGRLVLGSICQSHHRLCLTPVLWRNIEFSPSLAPRLTDADLDALLRRVGPESVTHLSLRGCTRIRGEGLEPLRSSRSLAWIDLRLSHSHQPMGGSRGGHMVGSAAVNLSTRCCPHMHARMHVLTCPRAHARMHTCIHAHAHMHTCTHAYVHTCTHAYVHMHMRRCLSLSR